VTSKKTKSSKLTKRRSSLSGGLRPDPAPTTGTNRPPADGDRPVPTITSPSVLRNSSSSSASDTSPRPVPTTAPITVSSPPPPARTNWGTARTPGRNPVDRLQGVVLGTVQTRPLASRGAAAPVQLNSLAGDTTALTALAFAGVDVNYLDKIDLAVEALRASGYRSMSKADLVQAINRIGAKYADITAGKAGNPRDQDRVIAQEMHRLEQAREQLRQTIKVGAIDIAPPGQVAALNDYLQRHPGFLAYLKSKGIDFVLASDKTSAYGEGVYINGTIYLGDGLNSETPEVFLRMLLHEVGHATYQRAVLPNDKLPPASSPDKEPSLPDVLNSGRAADLLDKHQALSEALAQAQAAAQPDQGLVTRLQGQIAAIETELGDSGGADAWNGLPDDAKTLYNAWLVLRQGNGQHLLGLDLGTGRGRNQRLSYQAGTFTEFVAETFMQAATGEINDFLYTLVHDPNTPRDVREAWMDAARVLDKHAQQAVLGLSTAME
jgi:hypothetical protein